PVAAVLVGDRADAAIAAGVRAGEPVALDGDAGQRLAGVLVADDADDGPGRRRRMVEARAVVGELEALGVVREPRGVDGLARPGVHAQLLPRDRRPLQGQVDDALAADALDLETALGVRDRGGIDLGRFGELDPFQVATLDRV